MMLFTLLSEKSKNILTSVSTGNSDAYIAYLCMFDTNNIKQRKELLPIIVEETRIALLFLKNCHPNMAEKEFVFQSILNDKKALYKYLSEHNQSEDQIDRALDVIINDHLLAYDVAKLEDLNIEQRQRIYNAHKDIYKQCSNISYIGFCLVFRDCIDEVEKQTMVDIIYEAQDKLSAKLVLNNNIDIKQELKSQLESILVLARLYRNPLRI